jgi:hypothetical protein
MHQTSAMSNKEPKNQSSGEPPMFHQNDTSQNEDQRGFIIARDYERYMRQIAKECGLKISKQRTASKDPDDWRYIVRRERSGKIVFGDGYTRGLAQSYMFVRSWNSDRHVRLRKRRLQVKARQMGLPNERP